ncbi:cytochrome P450 [Syncephalis plumigaleata]|nr:cytochrome P450 [Syncephalis plumigaleata]
MVGGNSNKHNNQLIIIVIEYKHLYRAIVNLLNHPECLDKLRAELDATFPSIDETITPEKVQNLPYLNAVIHESMRCIPVTGLEFDRVVPAEGATLCDHYLPGGTTIKLVPYPIMHDKNNFSDPYQFNPERWMVEPEELAILRQRFFGFSMGVRVCLGRK